MRDLPEAIATGLLQAAIIVLALTASTLVGALVGMGEVVLGALM
jgi:hypothetical protein